MEDILREIGSFRVNNLADFGVLADTIEVVVAVVMIVGGIFITHRIQVWADRVGGEHPGAVNRGEGGGFDRFQQRGMRE